MAAGRKKRRKTLDFGPLLAVILEQGENKIEKLPIFSEVPVVSGGVGIFCFSVEP